MMRTAPLAAVLLSALALAQYPLGSVGFNWTGSTTPSAGTFCWGFTCAPYDVTVVHGETGTLLVRGDWNQPYVIAISLSGTSCLSLPGIYGNLILDLPIEVVWSGYLSTGSPILACPPGYDTLTVTVPASLPSGSTFVLQSASGGAGGSPLALSVALRFTIA